MAETSIPSNAPAREAHRRALRLWLAIVAVMVFAMVIVGGATRLTDSGLSIVEWKPVTGAIPPLTQGQWEAELEKYKQIPEYRLMNQGMSLDEFKFIYWWEWSHRQLGRLIGLVFAVPLIVFWLRGQIEPHLKPRLLGLLVLGGSQGALGWWMVASGLTERTDVSQYRLAMHLTLASFILAAIVWVRHGLAERRDEAPMRTGSLVIAMLLPVIVLCQIFLGGLVAGLDAGLSHTTWPLMDGHFIPPLDDLYVMKPGWVNHFENVLTVQFQHRMMAYGVVALVLWHAVTLRGQGDPRAKARSAALLFLVVAQAGIGIMTLILAVPIWAGLLHQAWAILILVMATVHAHASLQASRSNQGVTTGALAATPAVSA